MAHTKSALKRLKTSTKARLRHKSRNSELSTVEKKFRAAIESSELTLAEELYNSLVAKFDKAVKAGTIHGNKASRKKSRLTLALNTAKASKK